MKKLENEINNFKRMAFDESQTQNNPPGEWNMDSWNNNQGRKIVKDI